MPAPADKAADWCDSRRTGPSVFGVAGPIEQRLIMDPVVGIDAAHICDAVGVLELGRLRRDQDVKRLAVLLRVVGPIGFDRVPELLEAFLVGAAVLYDEGGDALGMLESEAPADGRPIVHDVHRIALHAE